MIIILIIQTWWGYWDFSGMSHWTLAMFLYVLLMPILIFLAAYLIIPAYRSKDSDWVVHFYAIRFWLFLTMIVTSLVGLFGTWIFLRVSLLHPYRIFQVLLCALLVVGLASNRRKVHGPHVIIYIFGFLLSQIMVRMQLGAFVGIES